MMPSSAKDLEADGSAVSGSVLGQGDREPEDDEDREEYEPPEEDASADMMDLVGTTERKSWSDVKTNQNQYLRWILGSNLIN